MGIRDLFRAIKSCRPLVNIRGRATERYRHFREFLAHNHEALSIMAELEQTYYGGGLIPLARVEKRQEDLLQATRRLVNALNGLGDRKYPELLHICRRIEEEIAPIFRAGPSVAGDLVVPLESLTPEMIGSAGAKATNLARMRNDLGAPIPPGFLISAHAFERFLMENGLTDAIDEILARLSPDAPEEMELQTRTIQEMVLNSPVPPAIADAILEAYGDLASKMGRDVPLAMRSSAVGEDTETSFAGQYATLLNVTREGLLHAYRAVLASKYTARAILYRLRRGLGDRDTPMCVAGLAMVDARASGVIYTADPSRPGASVLAIHSIWGLGEHLVSGEASPDVFSVDKRANEIIEKEIRKKDFRLVNRPAGGTRLEETPEGEKELPSINDDMVRALARYGLMLEEYFRSPEDIEWAVDQEGNLFILQSRPLGLSDSRGEKEVFSGTIQGYPVLLAGGKTASSGTAVGRAFIARGENFGHMPEDAILVTRAAMPDYARLMGRVMGIITDIGSIASHLSSVAREFGVPAIVDAGNATATIAEGERITMVADTTTVYRGIVPELAASVRPTKGFIFESPVHRRMRAVLDKISPLNLTDPGDSSFSAEGCKTVHDIIRFSHEIALQEMFGLSESARKGAISVKLATGLPLTLYCVDLGGGLKKGLSTCDPITPDHIASIPLKALWGGLTHPGISWAGTMASERKSLLHLFSLSALSELGLKAIPGGDSYAVLSGDYLNLSARFAYHYANIDVLCGKHPDQNYASIQFAGGGGTYYGRFFRIHLLTNVLECLGFTVSLTGDLLKASLKGYDAASMEEALNQLGRLLASTGLLDMVISSEADVDRMTEAFFRGDYDALAKWQESRVPGFYTHTGQWSVEEENGRTLYLQDGSRWKSRLSSGLHGLVGKMAGARYQEFLDNIEAYYYFPMAIAKDSALSDAAVQVRVKAVAGSIDRAGGIAFGIKNVGNYFALRINALEDNFILFQFVNEKRLERAVVAKDIETGKWYAIKAEISGQTIRGFLDDELLIEYRAGRSLEGYVGLWTKADSVTFFRDLAITRDTGASP